MFPFNKPGCRVLRSCSHIQFVSVIVQLKQGPSESLPNCVKGCQQVKSKDDVCYLCQQPMKQAVRSSTCSKADKCNFPELKK